MKIRRGVLKKYGKKLYTRGGYARGKKKFGGGKNNTAGNASKKEKEKGGFDGLGRRTLETTQTKKIANY